MRQCLLTLRDLRPISKKNSKRWLMRGRRPFLIPSKAYESFEKEAVFQIQQQIKHAYPGFEPFATPISATYFFVLKGRLRADVDNLMASINDVLQKAGVIVDDNLIVMGAFHKEQGKDWHVQVELEDYPETNS